jgi:hypothetical protein
VTGVLTESCSAARRFYAQRNCEFRLQSFLASTLTLEPTVYLTGATLFLSLILSRVFYIILDFIHVQESYTALQSKTAKQSGANGESEELRKRIRELESQLSTSNSKDRDFGEYWSMTWLEAIADMSTQKP